MGIYPNHGIEYWVEVDRSFNNSELQQIIEKVRNYTGSNMYVTPINSINVLPMARTDDRLIKSKFFKDKEDDWFNRMTLVKQWREAIADQSLIDIELTHEEMCILQQIREQLKYHIIFEGWFDVNTIGYTL